jgi:hypothetical protein
MKKRNKEVVDNFDAYLVRHAKFTEIDEYPKIEQ